MATIWPSFLTSDQIMAIWRQAGTRERLGSLPPDFHAER